ncbi:MAG: hypothetical protein PUE75_05330 [Eubacteriales bacterium]|nr:hypothetical protein [Eubacteriales bacterium]
MQDTIISLTVYAGLHVTGYSADAFHRTLGGPFNKPFTAPFQRQSSL